KDSKATLERPGAWPPAWSWISGLHKPGRRSRVCASFLHERLNALGEQSHVKRLFEGFAETVVHEGFRCSFVFAGQRDDQGLLILGVAAQVLGDLQGFTATHGQVDDDRIGMKA